MSLRTGRYVLGPDDGAILIHTGREGPAARLGHDLTLLATQWHATLRIDAEVPSRSRVTATVESGSLVVQSARGGAIGLTDAQKDEIRGIVAAKVLRSERGRLIRFTSTAVDGAGTRAVMAGRLTIARRTRDASFDVRVRGLRVTATTSISQTDFGITPYSAMLGALRVTDAVRITVSIRLPRR